MVTFSGPALSVETRDRKRGDILFPNGEVGEIPTRTRHGKRSNTSINTPLARSAGKAIEVKAASPETYPR